MEPEIDEKIVSLAKLKDFMVNILPSLLEVGKFEVEECLFDDSTIQEMWKRFISNPATPAVYIAREVIGEERADDSLPEKSKFSLLKFHQTIC